MSDRTDQLARLARRPAERVAAAARPLAVASAVALSTTGIVGVPAADAAKVQQRLVADGYLQADEATGVYDPRTGAALARWQADRGLRADGLVDQSTADHLLGLPHPGRTPR